MSRAEVVLELDGIAVTVTNPERPMNLKRFPSGAEGDPFYQKRAPTPRPDWIATATVTFPSGRTADEVVCTNTAGLAWVVNLGCIDLNPWPVRSRDVEHPDELRIDLDPQPDAAWDDVQHVALVAREVLADNGLVGFPKTSGSRGIHINVRIGPKWTFNDVRRAAVALSREMERRAPHIATTAWWKEERHGVFMDYNQNARDRTVASAYSVRPRPDARVSTPVTWDELPTVDPAAFTIGTILDAWRPSATQPRTLTRTSVDWTACSHWPTATPQTACKTHPGRRTTQRRKTSQSVPSRAADAKADRTIPTRPRKPEKLAVYLAADTNASARVVYLRHFDMTGPRQT